MKNLEHLKLMLETLQQFEDLGIINEEEEVASTNIDYDKVDKLLINLPKFSPTENWGDPNHVDRKEIDSLMRTFRRGPGGKQGIRESLQFLQRIQVEGTKISSPRRILRSIITLEILSMIIKGFGASAAGFVFEAFIAAMLGGKQVTETRPDGGLPITDVVGFSETKSGNVAVSLKLLSDNRGDGGSATSIEGSYKNLIEEIDQDDVVVYLIAYKYKSGGEVEKIKIGSFEFNRDNVIEVLNVSSSGKKLTTISNPERVIAVIAQQMNEMVPSTEPAEAEPAPEPEAEPVNEENISDEMAQNLADQATEPEANQSANANELAVQYIKSKVGTAEGLDPAKVNALYQNARNDFGDAVAMNVLRSTDGYKQGISESSETQWAISGAQYFKKLPESALAEDYGEISFSEQAIRETVAIHINNVRDTLISMLESLRLITEETNKYLLTQDRGTANRAGSRALSNAKNYEDSLSNQLKDDSGSGDE